ncbi:MAG: hypothetical protein WAO98_10930 [Alphaproteobacteria bacterium]
MIRTSSVLFWFGLIIVASLALYRTSDRVHELNQQLRDVTASIEAEQQRIHVLKAEWVYLANPARIENSARRHLALRPTSPQQVVHLDTISEILPTRKEAMALVSVTSTPMATVKTSLAPRPVVVTSSPSKPAAKTIAVAAADSGHINDHMIMERTASAKPVDPIGNFINELGTHP